MDLYNLLLYALLALTLASFVIRWRRRNQPRNSYFKDSAYHESAHALVCMEYGGTFDYIEVHDKGGAVHGMHLAGDTEKVLMFLAGLAVFKLFGWDDRWNRHRSRFDVEKAKKYLPVRDFKTRQEERQMLEQLIDVVEGILERRREALVALSELLIEQRRVDYAEAMEIVERESRAGTG